ncbi:vacuolar protein sorting-associated protein 37D-like [Plectropomus leopardus]|uniref:vacuolar protein sorting-associated protein 37D-like n=1 Tax=Plectropomus leopardus TaxID=160734 RepID=UPI001C4C623F|nr:vacuolar protein sorting-associated protein 37D-like [Plectropomus leopardus]
MSLSVQFGALRTRELRELLEDEDKINHIIRCSEKFQGLKRAAEKMLVSNERLAKVSLSQKPKFRDAKLILAMKYKELEKLRSLIQVKQEKLVETNSAHSAQWSLLKKMNDAEEECEMLFQRFLERKTPLAEFLDSFISSRKLQHIRVVVVKKLQEIALTDIHPDTQHFSVEEIHNACPTVCGLTTAVVLPACCHPPVLLPCSVHVNTAHCLQHLPLCLDYSHDCNESLHPRVHRRGTKWPARPVRLQPLRVQQRRHQQAPQ